MKQTKADHPKAGQKNLLQKSASNRKINAKRGAFIAMISIILAVIIRLSRFDELGSAKEFFSGASLLQMFLVSCIMAVLFSTILVYTLFVHKGNVLSRKFLPVLAVSAAITFISGLVFGQLVNIYIVPLMLSSLLVATLIDKRVGIITSILLSQAFFLTYILVFGFESVIESSASVITSIVASIFMIAYLEKENTRFKFIALGALVGLLSSVIPFLVSLVATGTNFDIVNALFSSLWAFLAAILSVALYMVILPVFEVVFKLNTTFRISEISSVESPLLRRLSKEAPGTFNHSLVVGNLAELCADAIGEDAQLAKAAAYYHDVGKLEHPECFIENQKGYNPHDDLIPEVSVSMITNHTQAGNKLIKKAGLPDIIADVAHEHHGTTPVNYFLYKAQTFTEDDLDKQEFSYNDPKPSSKISAIIMIVDTVEAATRARGYTNEKEFKNLIHDLIKDKLDLGQFSECAITFKDLQIIEDTLVEAIPNMYHARIDYGKPNTDKK
ncbi:MAG: HDIG domain-containing protein [Clostridia bacterium]|nr:HDIG domain-containing protein [Clostridia bacterium]